MKANPKLVPAAVGIVSVVASFAFISALESKYGSGMLVARIVAYAFAFVTFSVSMVLSHVDKDS
ncbi:hypothetical protein [Enterococcus sp. AZ180]|uniref:hypothetical protein n=1 Tax=Enterococcus sp. AZ180 TaxID=2774961 RepID=UPI003F24AC47